MCPCDVRKVWHDRDGLKIEICVKCRRKHVISCEFSDAIKIVRKRMQEDEGLWTGYQANIAMGILDNFKEGEFDKQGANNIADSLMKILFEAPRK